MSNDPSTENPVAAIATQGQGQFNSHITGDNKSYPKAEAEYGEIVQNPDVFLQKLQSFHSLFGTKFKVPRLGGSSLDLHHLFVQVTSRGGIEKVIRDRRWKEVTGAFRFPSSITSASFVLRKYYLSLLYHFEQVYYFRKEEPSTSVADSASRFVNGSAASQASVDIATVNQYSEIANLEAGSLVTGTIDSKCDYGYIISVDLGSEKLKGVLYHIPEVPQMSQRSKTQSGHTRRRRRKHQLALDPSRPKPNRSGYNFFFAEHYNRLKPSYHGQERAISKRIGVLWGRLSEAEKQVYQQRGLRDKERYRSEMQEYNASHL
ncbi:high mobility group B protein 10 [Coffea eugenioides]|uniref:High mobility group B protein 10 n=1 Tax=Coffea arabica TaxID=13443 RepID=A0A6P6XHY6_COFAR|nr:high mobility group B protein 10 [Coffea arabica]XP_027171023.1 high mobility group B protein 10 [Coffea eugenioides]